MLYLSREGCMKSIMVREKCFMCFVNLEKSFDRVPIKVLEWALRKKEIPEVLVRSVMSLYDGTRIRV